MIGGERQPGVVGHVVDRLHQSLAKGGFAHNQRAIVVLQGARDDFRRRSRVAVDHHNNGEGFAAVAVAGGVHLVRIGAAALGDDALSLGEQMVAHLHGLAQQPAGVAAQVQHQPLQVAEAVDGFNHFVRRGLPLANHRHLHVRALGALQRLGHQIRGHAVGAFAVDD